MHMLGSCGLPMLLSKTTRRPLLIESQSQIMLPCRNMTMGSQRSIAASTAKGKSAPTTSSAAPTTSTVSTSVIFGVRIDVSIPIGKLTARFTKMANATTTYRLSLLPLSFPRGPRCKNSLTLMRQPRFFSRSMKSCWSCLTKPGSNLTGVLIGDSEASIAHALPKNEPGREFIPRMYGCIKLFIKKRH